MPDALFELIPREYLADILTHIHSYFSAFSNEGRCFSTA